jgi:hypothetical protein
MHLVHTERVRSMWVTVRCPRAVGLGGAYREKEQVSIGGFYAEYMD